MAATEAKEFNPSVDSAEVIKAVAGFIQASGMYKEASGRAAVQFAQAAHEVVRTIDEWNRTVARWRILRYEMKVLESLSKDLLANLRRPNWFAKRLNYMKRVFAPDSIFGNVPARETWTSFEELGKEFIEPGKGINREISPKDRRRENFRMAKQRPWNVKPGQIQDCPASVETVGTLAVWLRSTDDETTIIPRGPKEKSRAPMRSRPTYAVLANSTASFTLANGARDMFDHLKALLESYKAEAKTSVDLFFKNLDQASRIALEPARVADGTPHEEDRKPGAVPEEGDKPNGPGVAGHQPKPIPNQVAPNKK